VNADAAPALEPATPPHRIDPDQTKGLAAVPEPEAVPFVVRPESGVSAAAGVGVAVGSGVGVGVAVGSGVGVGVAVGSGVGVGVAVGGIGVAVGVGFDPPHVVDDSVGAGELAR